MSLDLRLRPIVAIARLLDRGQEQLTMPERRARSAASARRGRALVMPSGPQCEERDLRVPVAGGEITVRIYRSSNGPAQPLHVFLHGGGWCVGTLDERDPRCREIAVGARCTVASIEYRLAPEHPYPVPLEDSYAALCWLVDHAGELRVDPSRVSVGGESAGGNLAAALCLLVRDRGGPALRYQWLDVPALDLTLWSPSIRSVPDGHLLDLADIEAYRDCYLAERQQAEDPYVSPLFAEDLSGLPPASVMACEVDKLRDDAVRYAERLRAAGVPVECRVLPGLVHPSFAFTRLVPAAREYERDAIAALAQAVSTRA